MTSRPTVEDLHRRSAALGDRMSVQTRHGRIDEPARVVLACLDVEPAGLDPRRGSEQVEQLGHLLRRGADHVDVTVGRPLERVEALERVREPRGRRERRPEVVARE